MGDLYDDLRDFVTGHDDAPTGEGLEPSDLFHVRRQFGRDPPIVSVTWREPVDSSETDALSDEHQIELDFDDWVVHESEEVEHIIPDGDLRERVEEAFDLFDGSIELAGASRPADVTMVCNDGSVAVRGRVEVTEYHDPTMPAAKRLMQDHSSMVDDPEQITHYQVSLTAAEPVSPAPRDLEAADEGAAAADEDGDLDFSDPVNDYTIYYQTSRPHEVWADVDTLEEYCERGAENSDKTFDELMAQETYGSHFHIHEYGDGSDAVDAVVEEAARHFLNRAVVEASEEAGVYVHELVAGETGTTVRGAVVVKIEPRSE